MVFNSLEFIFYFFAVTALYYLLPKKAKNIFLLAASIVFYAFSGVWFLIYLVCAVIFTYFFGRAIEKNIGNASIKRIFIVSGIVLDVLVLAVFKYTNFAVDIFNTCFGKSASHFNIIAPLGISFITFSTISYMIDISRGKIKAEKNIVKYALFVSFFPKVIQGPIVKAGDLLPQFDEEHKFDLIAVRTGLITALFGLFMKMVIADRAAIPVDLVFGDLASYTGAEIIFAVIMFTVQLYADFAGYSLIAIGISKALGFRIERNFSQPYFSLSISEFWRRWHISLNNWLKEYIYIPLGGNRCSKLRKNINVMITFTVSGIWHGAAVGYIIWGALNGVYVVTESLFGKKDKKAANKSSGKVINFFRHGKTIILVAFSWIFFRAQTMTNISMVFKQIFGNLQLGGFLSVLKQMITKPVGTKLVGMTTVHYLVLFGSCVLLIAVDMLTARKKDIALNLAKGNRLIRWIVLYILIFSIIVFGIYGYGYSASSFVYTQF